MKMRNWVHCMGVLFLIHVAGWGLGQQNAMGESFAVKVPKIHSGARLFDCCGFIMAVDPAQGSIIVNEKRIVVGKFRFGNKLIDTRLVNAVGKTIDPGGLGHGQWVTIRGYAVAHSEIFAVLIQADTAYLQKDTNAINKLQVTPF
jgi:hypothetical protein